MARAGGEEELEREEGGVFLDAGRTEQEQRRSFRDLNERLQRPVRGEEQDAWVITYMDVITLMLTLFVMLLAYADQNEEVFQAVTGELAQAAGAERLVALPEPASSIVPSISPVHEAMDALASRLRSMGLGEGVEIERSGETVKVQLSEKLLFSVGEARISESAFRQLEPIVDLLREEPYRVIVEGHTDDVPIANERFPSNWELSSARAAYVVRYFIEEGIPPGRLGAIGYADTRPRAENNDEQGRSRNRRVTLVLEQGSESEIP